MINLYTNVLRFDGGNFLQPPEKGILKSSVDFNVALFHARSASPFNIHRVDYEIRS